MEGKLSKKKQTKSQEIWYREKGRDYFRIYKKLDYYIGQALSDFSQNIFTLEKIQDLLYEETGFRFKKPTLRKYSSKMKKKHGYGPLIGMECYKLNSDYYKNGKIKPPRIKSNL